MRNELLVELALWAQNGFRPNDLPKLPRNIYGRRRREMDAALEVARDMKPSEWPRQLETPRRNLPPLDDQLVTGIKEVRDKYASELKIDPGFLLSTSNIATIAATRPKTPDVLKESGGLFQWQVDIMGDSILSVVKNPPAKKAESKPAPKPVVAAVSESPNI